MCHISSLGSYVYLEEFVKINLKSINILWSLIFAACAFPEVPETSSVYPDGQCSFEFIMDHNDVVYATSAIPNKVYSITVPTKDDSLGRDLLKLELSKVKVYQQKCQYFFKKHPAVSCRAMVDGEAKMVHSQDLKSKCDKVDTIVKTLTPYANIPLGQEPEYSIKGLAPSEYEKLISKVLEPQAQSPDNEPSQAQLPPAESNTPSRAEPKAESTTDPTTNPTTDRKVEESPQTSSVPSPEAATTPSDASETVGPQTPPAPVNPQSSPNI